MRTAVVKQVVASYSSECSVASVWAAMPDVDFSCSMLQRCHFVEVLAGSVLIAPCYFTGLQSKEYGSTLVTLEQALAPKATPPGPVNRVVRGLCAKVIHTMMEDLRVELHNRKQQKEGTQNTDHSCYCGLAKHFGEAIMNQPLHVAVDVWATAFYAAVSVMLLMVLIELCTFISLNRRLVVCCPANEYCPVVCR